VFKKLSGWVPPMLDKKTTCLTPAVLAASIWFLAPCFFNIYKNIYEYTVY
jgi:hypothetical protein